MLWDRPDRRADNDDLLQRLRVFHPLTRDQLQLLPLHSRVGTVLNGATAEKIRSFLTGFLVKNVTLGSLHPDPAVFEPNLPPDDIVYVTSDTKLASLPEISSGKPAESHLQTVEKRTYSCPQPGAYLDVYTVKGIAKYALCHSRATEPRTRDGAGFAQPSSPTPASARRFGGAEVGVGEAFPQSPRSTTYATTKNFYYTPRVYKDSREPPFDPRDASDALGFASRQHSAAGGGLRLFDWSRQDPAAGANPSYDLTQRGGGGGGGGGIGSPPEKRSVSPGRPEMPATADMSVTFLDLPVSPDGGRVGGSGLSLGLPDAGASGRGDVLSYSLSLQRSATKYESDALDGEYRLGLVAPRSPPKSSRANGMRDMLRDSQNGTLPPCKDDMLCPHVLDREHLDSCSHPCPKFFETGACHLLEDAMHVKYFSHTLVQQGVSPLQRQRALSSDVRRHTSPPTSPATPGARGHMGVGTGAYPLAPMGDASFLDLSGGPASDVPGQLSSPWRQRPRLSPSPDAAGVPLRMKTPSPPPLPSPRAPMPSPRHVEVPVVREAVAPVFADPGVAKPPGVRLVGATSYNAQPVFAAAGPPKRISEYDAASSMSISPRSHDHPPQPSMHAPPQPHHAFATAEPSWMQQRGGSGTPPARHHHADEAEDDWRDIFHRSMPELSGSPRPAKGAGQAGEHPSAYAAGYAGEDLPSWQRERQQQQQERPLPSWQRERQQQQQERPLPSWQRERQQQQQERPLPSWQNPAAQQRGGRALPQRAPDMPSRVRAAEPPYARGGAGTPRSGNAREGRSRTPPVTKWERCPSQGGGGGGGGGAGSHPSRGAQGGGGGGAFRLPSRKPGIPEPPVRPSNSVRRAPSAAAKRDAAKAVPIGPTTAHTTAQPPRGLGQGVQGRRDSAKAPTTPKSYASPAPSAGKPRSGSVSKPRRLSSAKPAASAEAKPQESSRLFFRELPKPDLRLAPREKPAPSSTLFGGGSGVGKADPPARRSSFASRGGGGGGSVSGDVPKVETPRPSYHPTPKRADALEVTAPQGGDEKEEADAALKIQAAFRGKKARESVSPLRKQREEEKKEEARAATKIQATFRGKKARESVSPLRKQREEEKEEAQAATKIQAVFRGKKARESVSPLCRQEERGSEPEVARTKSHASTAATSTTTSSSSSIAKSSTTDSDSD